MPWIWVRAESKGVRYGRSPISSEGRVIVSGVELRALVTGACGVTTRAVVRCIRSSSYFSSVFLVGVDAGENDFGFHEGLYDRVYRIRSVDDEEYWTEVAYLADRYNLAQAIVVPEREVLEWAQNPTLPLEVSIPGASFAQLAGDKGRLFAALSSAGLAPRSKLIQSREIRGFLNDADTGYPIWMRPHHFGVSSGAGAYRAQDSSKALAWASLHDEVASWQLAEFVSGRNVAVAALFKSGNLMRLALYERLEYFMGSIVPSGVSGNISRGRLFADARVEQEAIRAFRILEDASGERANGLMTLDGLIRSDGALAVTEVNLRPTACISSFAQGGFDIASDWIAGVCGLDLGSYAVGQFPSDNVLLRDIDGVPIWLAEGVGVHTVESTMQEE